MHGVQCENAMQIDAHLVKIMNAKRLCALVEFALWLWNAVKGASTQQEYFCFGSIDLMAQETELFYESTFVKRAHTHRHKLINLKTLDNVIVFWHIHYAMCCFVLEHSDPPFQFHIAIGTFKMLFITNCALGI